MDLDRVNELLPYLARAGIILPAECAGWSLNSFLGCLHAACLTAETNGFGAQAGSLNGFGLSLDRGPLDSAPREPRPVGKSIAEVDAEYQQFEDLVTGKTAAQPAADFDALLARGRNPDRYRFQRREQPDGFYQ